MQIQKIAKPTVENRTGLGREYDRLMNEIDMPIYNWCREQEEKNKNIKL